MDRIGTYLIALLACLYFGWPILLSIGCLATAIVMMFKGDVSMAVGFGTGFVITLIFGCYWVTRGSSDSP